MKFKYNQQEENNEQFEDTGLDENTQYLMDLNELLKETDPLNAPPVSLLESWQNKFKNIYVSKVVDPNTYYVWRVLRRGEFKKLNTTGSFNDPMSANEILVETCLLYPTPATEWRIIQPAGVIETLGKQISYQSGFIPDNEALSLIKVL